MNAEETFADEFESDPLDRGYSTMSMAQRWVSLNDVNRDVIRPLTTGDLRLWVAAEERAHWIKNAVENSRDRNQDPITPAVRSVAVVADTLISVQGASVDLSNEEHSDLLQVLMDANVLTEDDGESLTDLATATVSRAVELTGGPASTGDVARASE